MALSFQNRPDGACRRERTQHASQGNLCAGDSNLVKCTAALHALGGADGVFLGTTGEQSSVRLSCNSIPLSYGQSATWVYARLRSISHIYQYFTPCLANS